MTRPLASCIVPVYNGERYLAETVGSILAQTYRPLEILVVDDGSSDRSAEIAEGFGDPVRCIRQPNAGPPAARNTGLDAARGELIAFLDADDLWVPEKLERHWALMAADPELDCTVSHAQNFWPEELAHERDHFAAHPRAQPMPAYITGAMVARRRLFDRVGRFATDRKHTDATEWFLRARQQGIREALLPEALLLRRMHQESLSRQLSEGSATEFLHLLKRTLDQRRGAGQDSELVSCIIPVYNGERFLGEAIESVLGQTYRPIEVIVVDDGSVDATPQVVARFGDRIRGIRQANAGPAAARNAGLAAARGSLIAFLDADDLWLPDKLAVQVRALREHADVELCFVHLLNFRLDPAGGPPEEWPFGPPYSPCSMLARRALFERIGTFDERLRGGEDTEWFARVMMQRISFQVLPDSLVRRRQHDRNLTRVDPPNNDRLLDVLKMALDKKRADRG